MDALGTSWGQSFRRIFTANQTKQADTTLKKKDIAVMVYGRKITKVEVIFCGSVGTYGSVRVNVTSSTTPNKTQIMSIILSEGIQGGNRYIPTGSVKLSLSC